MFFTGKLTDEAQRAKADYYDVWSGIFRNTFFKVQADWCAKNNVEYLVHLNHEETMMALVRSEGDFFRDMRHVQVPGIDNLSQLVPERGPHAGRDLERQQQLPQARLFGGAPVRQAQGLDRGGRRTGHRRQVPVGFSTGARRQCAADPRPGDARRRPGGARRRPPPQAPMLAWYTNRAGYLMAIGRPAAQVGLYHPANSMWMGDEEADRSTTKLGWQLFEHQVDWDYFDEQSLSSVATIENGGFKNLSGQVYRAIVVPSSTVITRTGLERFQAFRQSGRQGDFRGQDSQAGGGQDVLECQGRARPELRHADRALGRHHAARARGAAQAGCEAGRRVSRD